MDFRAAKKNKAEPRPLSLSVALLEGAACPWREMAGCSGSIVALSRLASDHVFLRCSNNDPQRLRNKPSQLCSWSFNSVREADPDFATQVLQRREGDDVK